MEIVSTAHLGSTTTGYRIAVSESDLRSLRAGNLLIFGLTPEIQLELKLDSGEAARG